MISLGINLFKQKKINFYLLLFFTFLITRSISSYYFDITIEEKWLTTLWQHIKFQYMIDNISSALIYFHAQPPVWNLILGIGLKFKNILDLTIFVQLINIFITLIILYSSHQILRIFNFKYKFIYIFLTIFIILSPSILFYENFPSYSHFTCMLIFLIKLFFLKIYKKFKIKYLIYIYSFSSLLILTWSAYIIYFNFLIFLLLWPITFKNKVKLKSIIIFIFFFLVATSPSIKNKILFNIFANSSWTGLNASQATGYDNKNWPLCSFQKTNLNDYNEIIKESLNNKEFLDEPILNDRSFNDLGFIYKSQNCSKSSKIYLLKNFIDISKNKIKRFISVHAHLSIDFAFKPKNWVKNFSFLEFLNINNYFKILVLLFFSINYLLYLLLLQKSILRKNKDYLDYFIIINFILYSYLMIISFYGSTWEQERMRYTGYSFIFISIAIQFIKKISYSNKLINK